jgi:hypothetical protein
MSVRRHGELFCVPGDMGLSAIVEAALLSRFGARVRADAPAPAVGQAPAKSGTPWFCPACRVPLRDDMSCGACSGTLHDLRFHLVELHPHRRL